jgi:hypothetical protein
MRDSLGSGKHEPSTMSKLGVPPPYQQQARRVLRWNRRLLLVLGAATAVYGLYLIYLAPTRWWGGTIVILAGCWLLWKYRRPNAAA